MGIEERPQARLDSWKEIAAYFGCDERTVKRWEGRRGLPVHRAPGGGKTTVYAYVAELEAWLRRDAEAASAESASGEGDCPVLPDEPVARRRGLVGFISNRNSIWWTAPILAVALLTSALLASSWVGRDTWTPLSANAEANRLYNAGLYSWQTRTPAGLGQAVADFKNAVRADPKFAAAYAELADCYNLLPEFTTTPASQAFPKAEEAAARAIALDEHLAAGHRALGYAEFWWSRDDNAALREFRRAIALDPNSAQTHHWYATMLGAMGLFPEALREIDLAERTDPGSTALIADKGLLLVDAGHLQQGISLLTQVENAQPQFAPTHTYLAFAYRAKGDGRASLREMRWHAQLQHNADEAAIAAAGSDGLAVGGYREMLRRMLTEEEYLHSQGRFPEYLIAVDYERLGEPEQALKLLSDSVAHHEPAAVAIRVQVEFRPLYSNPDFQKLIAREGFSLPRNS